MTPTDPNNMDWWPNLGNRKVAIIAAGPSLNRAQCDLLQALGYWAVAINESWRLAPWCDVHYICDWQYAAHKAPRAGDLGAMRMIGTWPKQPPPHWEAWGRHITWHRLKVVAGYHKLIWKGPAIGAGGNSAFQMLNWVLRCGAKHVVFVGLDCHTPNMHWHGSHDHPEKPIQKEHTLARWRAAFDNAAKDPNVQADIFNCSPASACKAFPFLPMTELLPEAA